MDVDVDGVMVDVITADIKTNPKIKFGNKIDGIKKVITDIYNDYGYVYDGKNWVIKDN
jgi:hypothetical protein